MLSKSLFQLFRNALRKDAVKDAVNLDGATLEKIYKVSAKHDMAHLVGYALKISGVAPDAVMHGAFKQAEDMAVFRYVRMKHELGAISAALEKAGVRFIPLKGSVIRRYYPEEWMRTSCDIDILVSEADVERAKSVLGEELGYSYKSSWSYEHSFVTPSNVHVELHYELSDDSERVSEELGRVWECSAAAEGWTYLYEMSDEMYYLYHLAHMAKHFVNGGCGIRPFMDIWVLNHLCEFERDKRYAVAESAGLLRFAKAAEALAEVWFGDMPHSPMTEQLEQFILNGGTYGTVENRVVVQQAITGGRFSYILSRVFLPYEKLKLTYPRLEGRRWLMPFYQVKRWFRLLRRGKFSRSMKEAKRSSAVTSEEQGRTTELLKALGLK